MTPSTCYRCLKALTAIVFILHSAPLKAQVAVFVETNRKFGMGAGAAAADDTFRKGVAANIQSCIEGLPLFLETRTSEKPRYRIAYRENFSVADTRTRNHQGWYTYRNGSSTSGIFALTNTTTTYRTLARVTLQLQELKGSAYVTLNEWGGKCEDTITRKADTRNEADFLHPPDLNAFLWEGLLDIKILRGSVDAKSRIVTHSLQVRNKSPWDIKRIAIKMKFSENSFSTRHYENRFDVNVAPGSETTLSTRQEIPKSVKNPKRVVIERVGLSF